MPAIQRGGNGFQDKEGWQALVLEPFNMYPDGHVKETVVFTA